MATSTATAQAVKLRHDPEPEDPAARVVLGRYADQSADRLPMAATQGRTMDARFADLDDDGDMDLVLATEFGQNLILRNDGRGWFNYEPYAMPQGELHDSEDIAIADLNRDGLPDLIFVSEDDRINECYLSDFGNGYQLDLGLIPLLGISNAVLACDLNGDDRPDLIIGNNGQNAVLIGRHGGFDDQTAERLPTRSDTTQDLELGDIDGDGDDDLIVANEDGNRILINNGAGVFTDQTSARYPELGTIETREADLADLNGDGHLDLVLANVGWVTDADPTNRVLMNDGTGVFVDETAGRFPSGTPLFSLDIDAADLDRDGDLDLVVANFNGLPQILLNDGSGVFTDASAELLPWLADAAPMLSVIDVEAIDVNGDGQLDLYLANRAGPDRLLIGTAAER